MSSAQQTSPPATQVTAAQVVVESLLRSGISGGFGIPSIHNIGLYDALRQEPRFRHWIVRHEQAAVFAADGFYRASGRPAAVFASTGPGNLFTVSPLLESYKTNTSLVLMGTNVAVQMLDKVCGALHETPQQLDIFKPLTRFATRITSPGAIPEAIAAAAKAGGPAFIEIPHDVLVSPAAGSGELRTSEKPVALPFPEELGKAVKQIGQSRKPVLVVGSEVAPEAAASVQRLAEMLQSPVMTTTSGKGVIADDHPLAMGCISRLGLAQELLLESDLLISVGARFTEFDTGRYTLRVPASYIQIEQDLSHAGWQLPFTARLIGEIGAITQNLSAATQKKPAWYQVSAKRAAENEKLKALRAEPYELW
ncbi:MAG TPA: thiamine pyrophosphate-binding protein [Candidatus Angelobacter sp.]